MINAFLGQEILITFVAAEDSQGGNNYEIYELPVLFTTESGLNRTLYAEEECDYNDENSACFEFVLDLDTVLPRQAGNYTARLGMTAKLKSR